MTKLIKWGIVATASLPLLSLAQGVYGDVPAGAEAAPVRTFEDVLGVLDQFILWFQAILFIVAIIFILIAAFYFVTAGGNSDKISTAKTMIIWAAVGIGIALLAYAVKPIVLQLLGG